MDGYEKIPIPCTIRNDELSSRAPFSQGFGENSTVNPLSGSARFKIYRRRVVFAIPTRKSRGVLLFVGERQGIANARGERELHKHARTRHSTNESAAATP